MGPVWVSQAFSRISLGITAGMRRRLAEERGEDTSVRVVGRRPDLCGCRRPSAGSILDPWCRDWDASAASRGGRVGVWRLQRRNLEIFIFLNRTLKRRCFDVVFLKKKLKPIEPAGSPVGPPVQVVRPPFDPHPVQMTGPAGPVQFLKHWFSLNKVSHHPQKSI